MDLLRWKDLDLVELLAPGLGLKFNHSKTELICDEVGTREPVLSVVPDLLVLNQDAADLLGSPMGSLEHVGVAINDKIDQLHLMSDRLVLLHAQDALLLLYSLSLPKLLYILRTAPCFCPLSLPYMMIFLGLSLVVFVILLLTLTPFGILRAAQLAPSAFLSSAASSSVLVCQILSIYLQLIHNPLLDSALSCWQEGFDQPPPPVPASFLMRAWGAPHV